MSFRLIDTKLSELYTFCIALLFLDNFNPYSLIFELLLSSYGYSIDFESTKVSVCFLYIVFSPPKL